MSKQEEIRESIEQHVELCLKVSNGVPSATFAHSISISLGQLLDEQGVVIKVHRVSPLVISSHVIEKICGETAYLLPATLENAGYVAVEPLIKE